MQGDGATAAREASKTEVDLLARMHACMVELVMKPGMCMSAYVSI